MIFNTKYNSIIDLMKQTSNNFGETYEFIVQQIPQEIIRKCRKCKYFSKDTKNAEYILFIEPNDAIELSILNYAKGTGVYLSLSELKKEDLETMDIFDEDNPDNTCICNLGELKLVKPKERTIFTFQLKRVEKDKYIITQTHSASHEKHEAITEKIFTLNELLTILNNKKTKR